jgi:hypothetical protein
MTRSGLKRLRIASALWADSTASKKARIVVDEQDLSLGTFNLRGHAI